MGGFTTRTRCEQGACSSHQTDTRLARGPAVRQDGPRPRISPSEPSGGLHRAVHACPAARAVGASVRDAGHTQRPQQTRPRPPPQGGAGGAPLSAEALSSWAPSAFPVTEAQGSGCGHADRPHHVQGAGTGHARTAPRGVPARVCLTGSSLQLPQADPRPYLARRPEARGRKGLTEASEQDPGDEGRVGSTG